MIEGNEIVPCYMSAACNCTVRPCDGRDEESKDEDIVPWVRQGGEGDQRSE